MPWNDPLLASVLYRSSDAVEELMKHGCNPNGPLTEVITPLEIACENNDFLTAHILISHGADVNFQNQNRQTALHLASFDDVSYKIFRNILNANADINSKDIKNNTPLHVACSESNIKKIEAMLRFPHPPVNAKDDAGATPMHNLVYAIPEENALLRVLQTAVEKGFDVNSQTNAGETILHVVSQRNHFENILSRLLKFGGIDCTLQDLSGDNFLHTLLRYRRGVDTSEEFLRSLFEGNSVSCRNGIETVVNQQNVSGYLPLATYIYNGIVNMTLIRKLISLIKNADIQENLGHSLLHITIESAISTDDKVQTIKILVKKGANLNSRDRFGRTPLFYATNLRIVKLLVENGADIHVTDQCKRTVLMTLLQSGNPRICQYLIRKGSRINDTDRFGSNALHYAAWENRIRETEVLVKSGIKLNQRDRKGRTPYDTALFWRCKEAATILDDSLEKIDYPLKRKSTEQNQTDENLLWLHRNQFITFTELHSIQNLRHHFCLPADVEQYIGRIVDLPGVGITRVADEDFWVESAVLSVVTAVARQIRIFDKRFKCSVLRSGSTSENTKIEDPDEFDFLFVLDRFSEICTVDSFSDAELEQRGYVNLVLRSRDLNPAFDYYFDYEKSLVCGRLRSDFFRLVRRALTTKSIWQLDEVFIDSFTIRNVVEKPIVNFRLYVLGAVYKGFYVSIDVVPALRIKSWWPNDANLTINRAVTESIISQGCLLLCQEPDEMREVFWECGQSTFFRISCAPAEMKLMHSFPLWVRRSYAIAKMMKGNFMCPKLKFEMESAPLDSEVLETQRFRTVEAGDEISSYMLKNCLFHIISANSSILQVLSYPEKSLLYNSIFLALRIYDHLGKAAVKGQLPVYFLPYLNILEKEDKMEDNDSDCYCDIPGGTGNDGCTRIKMFCDLILKLNDLNALI